MNKLFVLLFVLGSAAAQTYRVCIPLTERTLCNSLDRDSDQAVCRAVESRVDCALQLARGDAHIGVFSEEESLLLALQQPNDNRVVATIRDTANTGPYAFEAVAIVNSSHTGGLEGLRGGKYCHPGFDQADLRWSPRVLKTFEQAILSSTRCQNIPPEATMDEVDSDGLSNFFSAGCRPGPWSVNFTIDATIKSRYANLCSLCGTSNATCSGYTLDMGVSVSGVNNNNRHIQALECLRTNGTVAYVAWQHVREFFTQRNPDVATSYAVLCTDGSVRPLTSEVLASQQAPCSFVRQPWPTIVTNTAAATAIQTALRAWWPNGVNPGSNTWQSTLFNGLVGGASAVVNYETNITSPLEFTRAIRPIAAIDSTASCQPARRWCTLNADEYTKCMWTRAAAYSLGLEPQISCQQRADIFECLEDIKNDRNDFLASSSNYGYLARQHFELSPIKLVQNSRNNAVNSTSRVAAFVKESASQTTLTRFENLKGSKACFPEFGGIAYMAFVKVAQDRGVISPKECDYAKAVGEFFDSACAPGAMDAAHQLGKSSFNATNLCTVCQPTIQVVGNFPNFTCAWDYSNRFFGNNGSLACLADPSTDVAFLQVQNIEAQVSQLNLNGAQYRALCQNNTLAGTTGFSVDDNCLLARVVDAEVVTRRNDRLNNALSVLLESLDLFFGYVAESGRQLINLEIFSPFDGKNDLLFRDSAIGFADPTLTTTNDLARNYIELFKHLEECSGASALVAKSVYSMVVMVALAIFVQQ